MENKLTHISESGEARMVDVSGKQETLREAVARASVIMKPETLDLIVSGSVPKGDVFAVARVAGIMAAKRTGELIPLCHPLPLNAVTVDIAPTAKNTVQITACATCSYRTGVEMEALTAASVAALTIYDMCKAVDRAMTITDVMLIKKSGGRSGTYIREGFANEG